ncbi:MAG TPA: ribosome-associated translation inhibitor RaiA [Cellulomonas sp.]
MEIVVAGRHTEVSARYRAHVAGKLAKVEQLAPRAQRVDVLVSHEPNPRQADSSERVELTVVDRGPVIRAEASADDPYAALDLALAKLLERLRRTRDRRREHRKDTTIPGTEPADAAPAAVPAQAGPVPRILDDGTKEIPLGDSPVVIREKVHAAAPMTVDDALYEMELVGHDFFLFVDADTGRPAVAYRRHGWSYGVIKLDTATADGASHAPDDEPAEPVAQPV